MALARFLNCNRLIFVKFLKISWWRHFILFSRVHKMASTSFADTTEPAKKRAKTSEIGLDSSSKISQNPFELELKTPPTSKNRPGIFLCLILRSRQIFLRRLQSENSRWRQGWLVRADLAERAVVLIGERQDLYINMCFYLLTWWTVMSKKNNDFYFFSSIEYLEIS